MIPRATCTIMPIRNGRAYWKIIICHARRCSPRILPRGSGAVLGGKSITLNSNISGRRNVRTTPSILVAIPCALLPRLSPASRRGECRNRCATQASAVPGLTGRCIPKWERAVRGRPNLVRDAVPRGRVKRLDAKCGRAAGSQTVSFPPAVMRSYGKPLSAGTIRARPGVSRSAVMRVRVPAAPARQDAPFPRNYPNTHIAHNLASRPAVQVYSPLGRSNHSNFKLLLPLKTPFSRYDESGREVVYRPIWSAARTPAPSVLVRYWLIFMARSRQFAVDTNAA